MISVVIVEDIEIIRNGIASIINATPGFNTIGTFENCELMLEEIEDLMPDILIMDIGLGGMSGIQGIKEVKKLSPDQTIIVLTVHEDDENVFEALLAGASGYLLKRTPPAQLTQALADAAQGGSPMNAAIAGKVISLFREFHKKKESGKGIVLNVRELSILQGLAKGHGYKRIASEIFISVNTIRYHIRNIYKKLHVNSQAEAIAKALKRGLI